MVLSNSTQQCSSPSIGFIAVSANYHPVFGENHLLSTDQAVNDPKTSARRH